MPRVARRTRQVTSAFPAIAIPRIRLAMPSIERRSSRISSHQLGAASPAAAASRNACARERLTITIQTIAMSTVAVTVCNQRTWRRNSHGRRFMPNSLPLPCP